MKNNKTKYEAPSLKVTELQTKDVIMASLITLTGDKLLGKGRVDWIGIEDVE